MSIHLFKLFILFTRNLATLINSPYIAFRKLSKGEEVYQSIFIFLLAFIYFSFASAIRKGIRNPYLLTLELNRLIFFAALGFLFSILLLYKLGKLFGGSANLKGIFLSWSYSLIPTIIWFFVTSISYLLLPPPRTLSAPGQVFSLIFIAFSLALLFWKLVMYYLTLRFSLKLDLVKIMGISLIVAPLFGLYGLLMYRIGVFRIPFI
ncbi:hypothetical protein HY407_01200 [Candidatus Gottesmanbacteria bacterium]|nr:hypothetical protein [Candidatus Gottesmanbacteria bacterium]